MSSFLSWAFAHRDEAVALLFTINAFFIAFVIVMENRQPERAHGWLLVLFAFPFIGFILYVFFGHNWHRHSAEKKFEAFQQTLEWKRQAEAHESGQPPASRAEQSLRILAASTTGYFSTNGNRVHILTDASMKYPRLFSALEAATVSIDMEYFIFRHDEIGLHVLDILKRKAKQGVRIRFLVDGYGSFGLGARTFSELRAAGIHAHYFAPLATLLYFFKANYRDHRKIVVIDNRICFTGGINIGKEYLGQSSYGYWRDTSLELRGPCVDQFSDLFEEAWRRSTKEARALEPRPSTPTEQNGESVSVVPSGPDAEWFAVQRVYVDMIDHAEHDLLVQTPYYIPDASIQEALVNAALRGVRVRFIFPRKADSAFFHWVAMTYIGDLLRAGVRVFEYPIGILHQKVMIADGTLACIGTCNIDIRSFRLDFEVNVILSGRDSIRHLIEDAERDIASAIELDYSSYLHRPLLGRVRESFTRLIAPLL
jgi:cardiolipin synthase A/B